jgi:hypothetical protein
MDSIRYSFLKGLLGFQRCIGHLPQSLARSELSIHRTKAPNPGPPRDQD